MLRQKIVKFQNEVVILKWTFEFGLHIFYKNLWSFQPSYTVRGYANDYFWTIFNYILEIGYPFEIVLYNAITSNYLVIL